MILGVQIINFDIFDNDQAGILIDESISPAGEGGRRANPMRKLNALIGRNNTGKTSLKYEEYVFTKDGVFERWAFDDNRQFNLIFSGTYAVDGNWVTVLVGDMRFGITISRITDTSMVFIRQAYEEDFKTKDDKIVPAMVTDVITTVRINTTR